jgi:hypothetical protein
VKAYFKSQQIFQLDREKIKEESHILVRGQREEVSPLTWLEVLMNELDIGGLTAKRRPIVDDFGIDFSP